MSKKGKELVKPGFELCGRLSGVDSEKRTWISSLGNWQNFTSTVSQFYAWEQGKSLQKSRLHRWSLSTYKVDNSKFTKLMRHIDSIFSESRDNLLSSRPACYSQHYSHAVVKPIFRKCFSGQNIETCLVALALRQILVRTFSRQSRSFPQQIILLHFT